MADLPPEIREQVRRAACLTWATHVLENTGRELPWIRDFDALWIRFYKENGSQHAWFANTPGFRGFVSTVIIGPEEGNPRGEPPAAEEVRRALEQCAIVEVQDLADRLRRLVPGSPGSLAGALYTQMERLMRRVLEQLPAELTRAEPGGESVPDHLPGSIRDAVAASRRISVRDLPDSLRELVRQAVYLHWGSIVLQSIEHVPSWLLRFDEASLAFRLAGDGEEVQLFGPASTASFWMPI